MTIEQKANTQWQLISAETLRQAHDLVLDAFNHIYLQTFQDAWMGVNQQLSVELRGFKYVEGWLTGFLVTPWMLSQIYIPLTIPDLLVDDDWASEARQTKSYVVIGPLKTFLFGSTLLKANLNYEARLGHYLLQPLVQVMDKYPTNDEAYAAWAQVIQFKQDYYAKLEAEKKVAEAQAIAAIETAEKTPVSRRDFLSKWRS